MLQDSLVSQGAFYPADPDAEDGSDDTDDERAALVLQLLLDSIEAPAPNLAHILMGYDVHAGPNGEHLCIQTKSTGTMCPFCLKQTTQVYSGAGCAPNLKASGNP